MALLAAASLAQAGCGNGSRVSPPPGSAQPYSFRGVATSLEVKKAEADSRGVLWLLGYDRRMYTLDPELYLSPLPEAGGAVEDFSIREGGQGQETPQGLYLAGGTEGLLHLAGDGVPRRVLARDDVVSVCVDRSGVVHAGTGDGYYDILKDDVLGPYGEGWGVPLRVVPAGRRYLCLFWENRLVLIDPDAGESRELEVPGELAVRAVALLESDSGHPWLVTSEGVFRLEEDGLQEAMRSFDPITSAAPYGRDGILLGKSSGRVTLWREPAAEERELAALGKAVDRLAYSPAGLIYAVCGSEISLCDMRTEAKGPVSMSASWELELPGPGDAELTLLLPESQALDPYWYLCKVKAGRRDLSWEISRESPFARELRISAPAGRVRVEASVVTRRSYAYRYDLEDFLCFPSSFPQEAENYLREGEGFPWDLAGVREAAERVPEDIRGNMLSVLVYLVKRSGLFYHAPAAPRGAPPPPAGTAESLAFAEEACARVLRGEAGDDYGRSLVMVMLCRELGIPARQALCFDRYLAQAYIYGVGWVTVDVSRPVYDLAAGSYPAIGALPGGEESFVTGVGGVEEGLRYAVVEPWPPGVREGPGAASLPEEAEVYAATLVVCRPASGTVRWEEVALALPGGGYCYFAADDMGTRFVRRGAWEKDVPVLQDEKAFPLDRDTAADLFLVDGRVVLVGPPSL
jgi:hypothetical protein